MQNGRGGWRASRKGAARVRGSRARMRVFERCILSWFFYSDCLYGCWRSSDLRNELPAGRKVQS